MNPGTPPLKFTCLLDQMRERIRYMHYSLSTEKIYLYWMRFFIRWHGREGQMQHPRDIGAPGVETFLTMLATERKGSASTHNQALSAVLFQYREPLGLRRCHQSAGEVAVQRGRDVVPRPRCDCGKCSTENRLWRYRCVLYQTLTTPNRVSEFGPGSLHPEKRHCGR